ESGAIVVDVAVAQPGTDTTARTYTGSTAPQRLVSLRSQTEGRLVNLSVDVGDAVSSGQTLGQVDAAILQAAVGQSNAELAAQEFEVAQAEAQLADARTLVAQAQAEFQQAEADAERLQTLAERGAISAQEAQRSQTTLETARQALLSAQEQARTRQQAIASAAQRVEAQRALVREGRQRLSNSTLTSPLSGIVLRRLAEPGDFLQAGQEVLELGNFSEVQVQIQVSDRDRSAFSLGQTVEIQLDAFPDQRFTGQVSRISPVADPASRLIPIDITLPNRNGDIGSGLLARVTVSAGPGAPIRVPESALETGESEEDTVFVVAAAGDAPTVEPRPVRLGQRVNGEVEILDGLQPGEAYVIRSSQPLQPGQAVERSLLSES
ncbi:MAG: efflux RND transporter periplasmic adaptor subunit, partial [Cyanobacteria bacterium Co-bin13]|nr:efflux RND transporter periplasmic adaptor subunit [Cyanobacteria bacterium Co-bin13]